MTSASSLLRSLLLYSICLPLAIFLGYLLAQEGNPIFNLTTYIGIVPILFVLALPLLIRWHHGLLIATWNLTAVLYFLPGPPDWWMAMAALSFTLSIIECILNPGRHFLRAPTISRPFVILAAVIIVTAACRGGVGLRSFGSDVYGGKRYLIMLLAILGYFAFISRPIPPKYAARYVVLFFLGNIVAAIGDLGSLLPANLYYIYLLFPIGYHGYSSIINDQVGPVVAIDRLGGVAMACCAGFQAMMARYGVRQLFASRHVIRLFVFLGFVGFSMVGGFRGNFVIFLMLFAFLFYFEGLMRSRLLPAIALAAVLIAALLVGFVRQLPLTVQRTLSVLQLPVDPIAKADAENSSEWRLNIWKQVVPQIPQYLLLGKGLGFKGKDLQSLTTINPGSGLGQSNDEAVDLVSDYHNGPLSIIIPFGLPGVIAFLWFLAASGKALYRNYRYGNPAYSKLNRFLWAYFLTKTIFFFFVFGSLYSDLAMYAGLVGLSISLNGGIARRFALLPPPPRLQRRPLRLPQRIRRPMPVSAGVEHAL